MGSSPKWNVPPYVGLNIMQWEVIHKSLKANPTNRIMWPENRRFGCGFVWSVYMIQASNCQTPYKKLTRIVKGPINNTRLNRSGTHSIEAACDSKQAARDLMQIDARFECTWKRVYYLFIYAL